jgi:HK97 gp10 family phage protein
MRISGGFKGVDKLLKQMKNISSESVKASHEALAEGILEIHATAVKSIQAQSSSSGHETRYNPKRLVKVSAEGHPPNTDTGRLVQSIQFEIEPEKGVGRVGTNLKYGADLEFGTLHMAARPWLLPALKVNQKFIEELFKKKLTIVIKEAA